MKHKLTWTCHICGKERPDDKISVHSKPIDLGVGVVTKQNVRYCNDNPDCIAAAPNFNFFDKDGDE